MTNTPFDTTAPARPYARNRFEAMARQRNDRPMTDGQRSYLHDLMLQKAELMGIAPETAEAQLPNWFASLSFDGASTHIDKAKEAIAALKVGRGRERRDERNGLPGADVVPEGRYAIDTQDGALNETAFYKVDRPIEGRWAGYVFVRRLVGPEEQRLSFAVTKTVLAEIAKDAKAASIRYGHEIGHCGRCGTRLTNDESRAYGIGPDCRKILGW